MTAKEAREKVQKQILANRAKYLEVKVIIEQAVSKNLLEVEIPKVIDAEAVKKLKEEGYGIVCISHENDRNAKTSIRW